MASKFVLICNTNNDANTTASEIAPNVSGNTNTTGAGAWGSIRRIGEFLMQEEMGRGINIIYSDTSVAASGTGTFTGDPGAAETMTIAGVTITARASGAVANEYNFVAGSVSLTAAALAAAVNASSSFTGILTASSALGVVTFTAVVPGAVGNFIPTVDVNTANFTFAQALLAGGSQAHTTTISAGL